MNSNSDRRQFIKWSTGALGLLAFSNPVTKAFASSCGITPPQTSGPFYPGEEQFHLENDLTTIPGRIKRAEGQVIYVRGSVRDPQCKPIEGATVEIWQASASGRYNNPKDSNPAPIDPNFRYWGETYTDTSGEYIFKTVIPGAYPASGNWTRPPHIHFKVTRLGYKDLVTQMYFKGNSLNDRDLILQQIPQAERNSVIVDFQPSGGEFEPGTLIGNFDITLASLF